MPRCKSCKQTFDQYKFNGKYCKAKPCQEIEREILIEKQTKKALANLEKQKEQDRKWKEELQQAKKAKKENTSLSYLKINVRTVCHDYIKLRDKGKPCVSCNRPWDSSFQAGHLYKAELYSMLKYDERNIAGQCQNCNLYKDGNESSYHLNILSRISQEDYDEIKRIASEEKRTNFKWDRQELNRIRDYYKEKSKEIKK